MLSNQGFRDAVTNVYKLSCGTPGGEAVENTLQLRDYFHRFLRKIYPDVPVNASSDLFVTGNDSGAKLAAAFTMKKAMGNPDQQAGFISDAYPPATEFEKIEFARSALDELFALDDDLRAIFELAVHSIVIRKPKRTNGRYTHSSSATTAVGVIWLSVVEELNKQDLQELLVHELVHQLLFIDDFVHSQFHYAAMSEKENFALTAVSLTPRPLDIVIHSIVVAAEILVARDRLLGEPLHPNAHPPTESMLATIDDSYKTVIELRNYKELVTPHIRGILDHSMDQIDTLRTRTTRRSANVSSLRV